MLATMFGNSWTTLIGVLLGILTYLQGVGLDVPRTKGQWVQVAFAALMAGLGIVAKDATTGSKPKP